jgi:hypothetical protein
MKLLVKGISISLECLKNEKVEMYRGDKGKVRELNSVHRDSVKLKRL